MTATGGAGREEAAAATDDAVARRCWQLFALASASFLLLLFRVQATGEEAVYSVEAYEQWYAHDWLRPTFLGGFYQRPPLFTDLVALLSSVIGWQHCLAAARIVSSVATVLSGLAVAAFIRRLGADPRPGGGGPGASAGQAAFGALVYLTLAEPLFYYGWLGYSDALFGALTLGGMLCAWLALRERHAGWLLLAVLLADAAFLTKALTAYVFVGAAGLVCLWRYRAWSCLWRPAFLLALLPMAVPLLWYAWAPTGNVMAHGMVEDITAKFGQHGLAPYARHLGAFALNAALNLMPAAGVAIWVAWRRRRAASLLAGATDAAGGGATAIAGGGTTAVAGAGATSALDGELRLAGAIALLNFLPYWLAPQSGIRYLMPLYGLMALYLSACLWRHPGSRQLMLRWALAAIVLKFAAGAWLFPAYTARVRPDLAAIAGQVESRAAGFPLYANTDAWVGLSVVALYDTAASGPAAARPALAPPPRVRPPLVRPPLVRPPIAWNDALLLSDHAEDAAPPSQQVSDFGGVQLYCRGEACRRLGGR